MAPTAENASLEAKSPFEIRLEQGVHVPETDVRSALRSGDLGFLQVADPRLGDQLHGGIDAADQIRAARALVRWRAEDLAHESAVGVATIRRAELAEESTSMTAANDLSVRRALEFAGVEFIDENGGGPGVRLRKR